jgi:hypothetical protein
MVPMTPEFKRVLHVTSFAEEERTRSTLRYWLSRPRRSASRRSSICGGRSMELAPDFDEFIACLIARGVEFIIVGAYALAFHGAPRFTGDLDVLVAPTVENATRLIEALE